MYIAAQHRVYAGFFLFAFAMGTLLSRLADLQLQFDVEEGTLGLIIIGMSCGSLTSLTFSARIVKRLGQKRVLYGTILGCAIALGFVPFMPDITLVFGCLFIAGLSIGALEIALNTEADRIEASAGRRIMSRAHGFWSIGFFVAALISIPIRQMGGSPALHMAGVTVLVVGATYVFFKDFTPAPERKNGSTEKPAIFARPSWGILGLCAVGVSPMLMEGTGLDWSVIYMRDTFDASPLLSGMSLTLFTFFMALGRLFADGAVDRFGPRNITIFLLGVCGVALIATGFAPNPIVALAGFSLMGGGASAIYPITVSEAARRTDRPAETNVAALAQIVFVVFLVGPPLLGFVAQYYGIRMTYIVCLPFVVLSIIFAFRLSSRMAQGPSGGALPTKG